MSRNLFIGVIGTVVIGATISTGIYFDKKDVNTEAPNVTDYNDLDDAKETETKPKKSKGTLEDMMNGKLGNNISCYSSHKVANDDTLEVISYISGKKIRVDYYISSEGLGWRNQSSALSHLHIIYDGEYAFIWGKAFLGQMMEGMKYKINLNDGGSIEKPDSEMTPDMLDYKLPITDCRPWAVKNSAFLIPPEVPFVNIDSEEDVENLFEETIDISDLGDTGGIDIKEIVNKDYNDPCVGCGFMPDDMKAACYSGC